MGSTAQTEGIGIEDTASKYIRGNNAQFWCHTFGRESISISPLDSDDTRTLSAAASTTNLAAYRVPSLLLVVPPVYFHDAKNKKNVPMSLMSLGQLAKTCGAHVFEVVVEAIRNFTLPASNTPFTEMPCEVGLRHALPLYVIRSKVHCAPRGELHEGLDSKRCFLFGVLHPKHAKPDDYDDDTFTASAIVGSAKKEVKDTESVTVVAFGYRTHTNINIRHIGNMLSPGHRGLLTQLGKTFHNAKMVQKAMHGYAMEYLRCLFAESDAQGKIFEDFCEPAGIEC